MLGTTVLHYRIEERLGQGGMGTVYRAHDTELNRAVAIKVIEITGDEARARLLHEARAASALNHPHIVTIHGVQQHEHLSFIVMEYVAGVSLDRKVPPEGLPPAQALRYAADVADALADAHAQGVVHRDIKPGNLIITTAGRVKVLDFGIARRTTLPDEATFAPASGASVGGASMVAGTPGYMAPEQIAGEPAGPASDVFALGAVLHYLLTGTVAFAGESTWMVLDATMRAEPRAVDAIRPGLPPAVAAIVSRALAKNPASRFRSGREMHDAIATALAELEAPAPRRSGVSRGVLIAVVGLVIAVAAGAFWWQQARDARLRWVHEEAMPEITRLATDGDPVGAFLLAQRALEAAPDDRQLAALWEGTSRPVAVASTPTGAEVSIRSLTGTGDWVPLGRTPFTTRLPLGQWRWRFALDGYEARELIPNPDPGEVALAKVGSLPPGMVQVPEGAIELPIDDGSAVVPAFLIDVTEVTNRQFKTFVDAGGYQKRDFWTQPFVDTGRTLSWDEAMARFRDATGRPGPSTWELGSFPDGAADHPVSGVSWYEAAAYAAFAGRALPTIYHWQRAANVSGIFSDVLQVSNFGGRGPQAVGTSGSLGPYGTADMAGNVKEWVWNESHDGLRFVLGGAWFEPTYAYRDEDARPPFTRDAGFGFRCMERQPSIDEALVRPVATLDRDPATLVPVGEEVFQAYKRLYDYDARPLEGRVDERDESSNHSIVERVSFTAAYGEDRVPMILMLPKGGRPPYQVAVYFPGSDATRARSSRTAYVNLVQFLVRSGRAVAFPIYQQTYERRRQSTGEHFLREISLQRGQDLRRAIDYLASRPDIDASKVAFYGVSLGAQLGPVYLAVEPRLKTGVLMSGGFETWTVPAETDPVNFAPRVTQPVLMVNGREDFDLPYQTSQVPLFNALGTAPELKRHAVLEGGHIPPRPQLVFKEVLDWLDRYLGPVVR